MYFRCYDILVRSHPEKLVSGLLLRLNSVDENIRVSTLIGTIHILRNHIFGIFDPPPPLRNHVFSTENNQKLAFSEPPPPLQVITSYMNGPIAS